MEGRGVGGEGSGRGGEWEGEDRSRVQEVIYSVCAHMYANGVV